MDNRIDFTSIDELTKMAMVPSIAFMVTMAVDLVYMVFAKIPLPDTRTVFNIMLKNFTFPVCIVFAAGTFLYLFAQRKNMNIAYARIRVTVLILFGCVTAFVTISTLINVENSYRYSGIYPSEVGFSSYVMFFAAFFLCSSLVNDERVKNAYYLAFLFLSIPIGIFAIYVSVRYGGLTGAGFYKIPEGIFYNPNHYGYYLAMTIVLSASMLVFETSRILKSVYVVILEFNTAMLIVNNTLGAWLAVLVGLAALVVGIRIQNGSFELSAIIALMLFVATTFALSPWQPGILNSILRLFYDVGAIAVNSEDANAAGAHRWHLWKATVGYISERPLFGWGPEGFADELERACGNPRAHNEFLSYAGFFGIPAGCCYTLGCGLVIINGIRNLRLLSNSDVAALVVAGTYLVSSCFGNIVPQTAPYFFIFLGFAFGGWVYSGDAPHRVHGK